MPIYVRRDRNSAPQTTRKQPGLHFTDANFASSTLAAGFANIFEAFPREGFKAWDGDMIVYMIAGHVSIQEQGGNRLEVLPGNVVFIPAGTRYCWKQINLEEVLVFVVNPLPFNPIEN